MIAHFSDLSSNERTYLAWIRTAISLMGTEPVHDLRLARAGSCLCADRGRTKEWTSVHD